MRILELARKAVREDGAEVIVLGCAGLAGYAEDIDTVQKVSFLADNQTIMYLFNLFIYEVAGFFLVVLQGIAMTL